MGHRSLSQLFNCAVSVQKILLPSAGKARDTDEFSPWVRKVPWGRKWQHTPVFLLGKFHGQRSLEGYSPWGRKESDTVQHEHEHPCKTSLREYVNEQACLCSSQNFYLQNWKVGYIWPISCSLLSLTMLYFDKKCCCQSLIPVWFSLSVLYFSLDAEKTFSPHL